MRRNSCTASLSLVSGMAIFGVSVGHGAVLAHNSAALELTDLPLNLGGAFVGGAVWASPMPAAMLATLALLSLAVLAVLTRVNQLRRQVSEQEGALQKASETSQAIRELSRSMLQVAAQRPFDVQFPVQGSEEVTELVDGFNAMLTEMQRRDRARRG